MNNFNVKKFESTYAMLLHSEEKQRNRFEALVYTVLIAVSVFAPALLGF